MADVITIQELVNARLDAISLEQIINGVEWIEVETRLGRKCYTVATINAIITRVLAKELEAETQINNSVSAVAGAASAAENTINATVTSAVTNILNKAEQARLNIDEIVASLQTEKSQILDDLQDAIDIAAAAGAGANGWTDRLVQTWSGRTQEQKNKDSIHVLDFKIGKTDQQAIQDAVNYCLANNLTLNWEGAHLTSTANILNFWDVQHTGRGTITRDGVVFNITPILMQVNNIYVSSTGSDTNDGLSSNTAVRQPNTAVAYIENYANSHDGIYRINLTAGTFQRIRFNKALRPNIEIIGASTGGYPNVPTTVITDGASVAATGVILMSECFMKDIKIIGYNGTASAQGISQSNARIKTDNVHVDDCYWGIGAAGAGSKLTLGSGKISNCGYLLGKASGNANKGGAGVRGMFHTKLELGIQNSGIRNLEITGCSYGARFQEYTTGHVDWCNIHNNDVGMRQYTGSRVNASGTLFDSNTRPYWLSDNSIFNPSSDTVFTNNGNQGIVGEGCSDGLQAFTAKAYFGFSEKFVRMFIGPQIVQTISSGLIVDTNNVFNNLLSNSWIFGGKGGMKL